MSVWSASLTSSSELSCTFKVLFKDFDEIIDNTVMLLQYEVAISLVIPLNSDSSGAHFTIATKLNDHSVL